MKIALHVCCGICLKYPLKDLLSKGFVPEGFYFNPNIHPYGEYLNRLETAKSVMKQNNLNIVVPDYNAEIAEPGFFSEIPESRSEQCRKCYSMRLKYTAFHAKANGIKCFSTTLLGSPYQDFKLILKLGTELAAKNGLEFVSFHEKWVKEYHESKRDLRSAGAYLQKYCGCIYSKMDRKLEKRAILSKAKIKT